MNPLKSDRQHKPVVRRQNGWMRWLPGRQELDDRDDDRQCKAETGRGRMSATNLFAGTEDYTLPLRTHTRQLPA
jgi:hypothetical protein